MSRSKLGVHSVCAGLFEIWPNICWKDSLKIKCYQSTHDLNLRFYVRHMKIISCIRFILDVSKRNKWNLPDGFPIEVRLPLQKQRWNNHEREAKYLDGLGTLRLMDVWTRVKNISDTWSIYYAAVLWLKVSYFDASRSPCISYRHSVYRFSLKYLLSHGYQRQNNQVFNLCKLASNYIFGSTATRWHTQKLDCSSRALLFIPKITEVCIIPDRCQIVCLCIQTPGSSFISA